MVDREERDRLAELLRHLASGQITAGEYRASVPYLSADRGVRAIISRSFDAYIDLRVECLEAPLNDDCRYRGDYALPPSERRTIARWVLFLQSDEEYGYRVREALHNLTPWLVIGCLATIPLAGVVAVLGRFNCPLALRVASIMGAAVVASLAAFAGAAMLGALVIFFHGLLVGEDTGAWPFRNQKYVREALKHPRLLCRKEA